MNKLTRISPYVFPGMCSNAIPQDILKRMRAFAMKSPEAITDEVIMDSVVSVTKIPKEDIIGHRRDRIITDARRMYIYNIKKYLNKTYVSIGKSLSGRDHTTIAFSIRMYEDLYKTDQRFKSVADKVTKVIEHF